MKTRTVTVYRVISVRADGGRKVKSYQSMTAVQDRVGRLSSPEPWRFWGGNMERNREGDELVCCSGYECGCGGQTLAQHCAEERAKLPALVSIAVEKRQVTRTSWEAVSDVTFDVPKPVGETEGAAR